MPIIKQAIKRAKQSLVRRSRNLQVKRAVKADVSALHVAIASGDNTDIQAKLGAAYSEIDRAVKKHTLHKNTAARRKSQLASAIAKAEATDAKPAVAKPAKKASATKAATTKKPAAKKAAPKKSPPKKPTDK